MTSILTELNTPTPMALFPNPLKNSIYRRAIELTITHIANVSDKAEGDANYRQQLTIYY